MIHLSDAEKLSIMKENLKKNTKNYQQLCDFKIQMDQKIIDIIADENFTGTTEERQKKLSNFSFLSDTAMENIQFYGSKIKHLRHRIETINSRLS